MNAAIELRALRCIVGARTLLEVGRLSIGAGERVAIVGHNGAGKSTLLRVLSGFIPPSAGEVSVLGRRLDKPLNAKALRSLRYETGQVLQGLHLVPRLSVLENVLIGSLGRVSGWRGWVRCYPEAEHTRAHAALASVGLADKAAILRKLSPGDLADMLGNSVRIHQPAWDGLGRRNEDQSKQLRRAYSRKSLRELEGPAQLVAGQPKVNLDPIVQGLMLAQDRAGLVVSADPTAGLGLILREEMPSNQPRPETAEAIAAAVQGRPDVRELMIFALTDDFFRLRQRVGVSLG